jgi:ferredoxin/flavodoxin
MLTAAIFYFSGTGNTWWASGELARLLRERGIEAQAHSIEGPLSREADGLIARCDLAGFGYPIYGSDLPQPMKDFMASLGPVQGKPAFVYCTQWQFSGDGARTGASFLKPKGFQVLWGEHFFMPNNVAVTILPVPYTNDRSRLDAVLDRAGVRLRRFADRIAAREPFRRGFGPVSFLLGCMQRVPFRLVYRRLQDDIGVDRQACTRCGDCARLCPSGNLVFDGEGFTTRGSCVLCLRCYNFCPVAAVIYMKRPHNHQRGKPYKGPVEGFAPEMLRNG